MLKIIAATILIASFASAGAAAARPGQCYTADGRPTGPAYSTETPDRDWIRFVIARGGSCIGADEQASPDSKPRFTVHETPNHRHLLRRPETARD